MLLLLLLLLLLPLLQLLWDDDTIPQHNSSCTTTNPKYTQTNKSNQFPTHPQTQNQTWWNCLQAQAKGSKLGFPEESGTSFPEESGNSFSCCCCCCFQETKNQTNVANTRPNTRPKEGILLLLLRPSYSASSRLFPYSLDKKRARKWE